MCLNLNPRLFKKRLFNYELMKLSQYIFVVFTVLKLVLKDYLWIS